MKVVVFSYLRASRLNQLYPLQERNETWELDSFDEHLKCRW